MPGTTPFIRPQNPGPFVPTPRMHPRIGTTNQPAAENNELTAAEIALQKVEHDEQQRLYNEVQAVEAILRTQIIEVIEEEYITSLRDPITDMIHISILEIFNFLKTNYGQLSPQQLKDRESNRQFNI